MPSTQWLVGLHLSLEKGLLRWFPETKSVAANGVPRHSGQPDRSMTSLQDFFSFQNPSICYGTLCGMFAKCASQSCNQQLVVHSIWLCSISCIKIAGYPEKLFLQQLHNWMQQSTLGFDKKATQKEVLELIKGSVQPSFQCDMSTYVDHSRTFDNRPQ